MEKYLVMAGLMLAGAIAFPKVMEQRLAESEAPQQVEQAALESRSLSEVKSEKRNPLDGRKAYIEMDRRGHFLASARMNGYKTKVLVDTGATSVAINESTARRLGIRLKPSDFTIKVRTANGITMAAPAMIDEIEIGRIRVRDVRATVSSDKALNTTLLGMAFLKKLRKFEISNGELILTQ